MHVRAVLLAILSPTEPERRAYVDGARAPAHTLRFLGEHGQSSINLRCIRFWSTLQRHRREFLSNTACWAQLKGECWRSQEPLIGNVENEIWWLYTRSGT